MNWKFLLTLLIYILFLGWAVHWWTCHHVAGCEAAANNAAVVTPPPAPAKKVFPLAFNWSNQAAVTDAGLFPGYRDSLLATVGDGQVLRIEGRYYPGEAAPEGFGNMGLARAAGIAKLFKPPLTDDQLELVSKLVEPAPNPTPTGLFASQAFSVHDADKPVMLEATEEEVTVYFPFGSANRLKDADVEAALNRLVESHKNTGRAVTVVGHTDSDAREAFNMDLSKRRANAVRKLLVSKGVASDKVTATGKGETQPKATNDTEAGRQQNRRVEIKLVK